MMGLVLLQNAFGSDWWSNNAANMFPTGAGRAGDGRGGGFDAAAPGLGLVVPHGLSATTLAPKFARMRYRKPLTIDELAPFLSRTSSRRFVATNLVPCYAVALCVPAHHFKVYGAQLAADGLLAGSGGGGGGGGGDDIAEDDEEGEDVVKEEEEEGSFMVVPDDEEVSRDAAQAAHKLQSRLQSKEASNP